jgi:hypothetical protein
MFDTRTENPQMALATDCICTFSDYDTDNKENKEKCRISNC